MNYANRKQTRDPLAQPEQVDLSAFYNLALGDRLIGKPYDTDLGSVHTGLQTFGRVLFDVRGVIHLSGQSTKAGGQDLPEQVEGIKVGRKCRRLHFLQAASDWLK